MTHYQAIAKEYADKNMEELFNLLRIETVSAQGRGIRETSEFVSRIIQDAGGESELLDDLGGHPVVYGFFKAGEQGDASKTLLLYNH